MRAPEDDILWIQKCLRGDKEAFCHLLEKYKVPIYNLAYRMLKNEEEAEDAFQEAFLQAFKSLDKYKLNYSFFTWIYTIALNICRNKLKKKWRVQIFSLNEPLKEDENLTIQIPDMRLAPDNLLDRKKDLLLVNEAINLLPSKYKAVIMLRYLENMSYQEIAEIVKLPLGTVKTQIHRGRHLMQDYIRGKKGQENEEGM